MGFFDKLKAGLEKTRKSFTEKIEELVMGAPKVDEAFLEELEELLIMADIGVNTTNKLMIDLRQAIKKREVETTDQIKPFLKERIAKILTKDECPNDQVVKKPNVILVVGVNGVGKTTTIGKLSYDYSQQGKKVMVAAGDTFRAAAIDQLDLWGKRTGVEIIKHSEGSDPAAVAFDAVQAALARNTDILLIDTAGRLHNKANLMEELKKIRRVISKDLTSAPHETLLVLDATTGQNGLNQAKLFKETVEITGIILTKLDGTAKGGIVIAIANELNLPIKWIGVGEGKEDLKPFVAEDYLDALFNDK